MIRRVLAALALAACLSPPARATAPTPAQPLVVFGNESVAYVEGARAVFDNPAGLGVRYPAELFATWSRFEDKGESNRWVVGLGGFALHGERVRNVSQRYGFTVAAGGERLRFGLLNEWLVDPRSHELDADHRLGALSRPLPWLSLGATANHLFQPIFRQDRQDRTYGLGVGLRPLALDAVRARGWGTRLTLTGDVIIADDGSWSQTRTRFGGELEVVPGIVVRGSVEDHRGAHLGIALLGPRSTTAAQTSRLDGHRVYETYAVSLHAGEEPTALASRTDRRVAVVRAGGDLGDESMSGFTLYGGVETVSARPLHRQLERALEDPLTRGVLLDLRGVSNMAQIEELRPRIQRLRAAGKPVVAFMEYGGGRGDLYLAAACDKVVMTPESEPAGLGLRVERRYYRQLLERWGIKVDRSSYGRYKSAFRNFSVDSTSAPDREVIEHNLDVNQELLVAALTAGRHASREAVLTILDGRPWRAADLRAAGLVDSVGYREDAMRMLGRRCGLGAKPRAVSLTRRLAARRDWTVPAPVAVIYAGGGIQTGKSGGDLLGGPAMGSETVVAQIERAFKRPGVKAVVLRVESPGGSALASDLIHHATLRMKRETKKPFVVSMGGVAASGGYYIASGGDRIFCDRFTRTGSIGVLTIKPSLEQFYARHGVRQDDFDRGVGMRGWSTNRDWTPEEQAAADSAILRFYHSFVGIVAADRGLSFDAVDAVAQGRVWMGEDALERKLVDQIGGLDDAVAEAQRRAGVPAGAKIRWAEYGRPRPGLLQRLVSQSVGAALKDATRLPEPGSVLYWDDGEAP